MARLSTDCRFFDQTANLKHTHSQLAWKTQRQYFNYFTYNDNIYNTINTCDIPYSTINTGDIAYKNINTGDIYNNDNTLNTINTSDIIYNYSTFNT